MPASQDYHNPHHYQHDTYDVHVHDGRCLLGLRRPLGIGTSVAGMAGGLSVPFCRESFFTRLAGTALESEFTPATLKSVATR